MEKLKPCPFCGSEKLKLESKSVLGTPIVKAVKKARKYDEV